MDQRVGDAQLQDVLDLMLVFFLGLISPGPDFAVVSSRASQYGRRPGIMTALGIASGVWILVFGCCYGLQNLFTIYPDATIYLQLFGAVFLGYLGLKALFTPLRGLSSDTGKNYDSNTNSHGSWFTGFITNVTNVKAILFISSVLAQKSDYLQTFDHVLLITALITLGTFVWFSFVAIIFSMRSGKRIKNLQRYVPKVMGLFLLYLAATFFISSGVL